MSRPRFLTEEQKEYIREHHQTKTVKEMREELGLSHNNTIYEYMNFAGLDTYDSRMHRMNTRHGVRDGFFNVREKENWLI